MTLLKFIGSAFYGIIISYLIWLFFYWLTPWVMSFGWGGVIISVLCGTVLVGLFMSIWPLILSPMLFLINNTVSKIIPSTAIVFYGYSSIMLPWRLNIDYTIPKLILAVTLTGMVLIIFATALQIIWTSNKY